MLYAIILILCGAFLLYTLLGGADFGAGIIESFVGKREERTISRAIAPVWEANHVWLILAIVILFMGFPAVYSSISVSLHIPLVIVLIGIIFRGSAFTFRHYDIRPARSHRFYTFLFRVSSFLTPFFLGIVLGGMILGKMPGQIPPNFFEGFVAPWLNLFCMSMGVFATCLFTYISAVFLVGETRIEQERMMYSKFAKKALFATAVTGVIVFVTAHFTGHDLLDEFLQSKLSVGCLVIAILLTPAIWHFLNKKHNKTIYLRIGVGVQVTLILLGWFYIQYPVLVKFSDGTELTFFNTHAPEATLKQLLLALLAGLILVIPGFVYLFKVFKINPK